MSRVKMSVAALFAVFAFSAMAAGSASAEHMWFVNGTLLKTTAALQGLLPIHGVPLLTFNNAGTQVVVGCSGVLHLINGVIQFPDLVLADEVLFLNCSTVTPTKCGLSTSTIKVEPVVGLATLSRLTFRPRSGKQFAEIPFATGNTCTLNEPTPVKGSVTFGVSGVGSEAVQHEGSPLGSVENNSLEVGTNKAFITGGLLLVLLANESKWSFKNA